MLHLSRLIGWINCDGNIDMGQPSTLSEKLAVIGVHGMASDHSYISIIFKFQILTDIRPAYINDPGHYSLKSVYRNRYCRPKAVWLMFKMGIPIPRLRHQLETFSALLAICAGNSPVPGEFPTQRPVKRSFGVFFDMRLNKRFSKQWLCGWGDTLSRPLWRHRNAIRRCRPGE